MPYIDQEARKRLAEGSYPDHCGELNFELTATICFASLPADAWKARFRSILIKYLNSQIDKLGGLRYALINDMLGAVSGCFLEFRRRGKVEEYRFALNYLGQAVEEVYNEFGGPYEDKKIGENGDVFPPNQEGIANAP
jgi:hypothetical protein